MNKKRNREKSDKRWKSNPVREQPEWPGGDI
jgi:hypothetical protein